MNSNVYGQTKTELPQKEKESKVFKELAVLEQRILGLDKTVSNLELRIRPILVDLVGNDSKCESNEKMIDPESCQVAKVIKSLTSMVLSVEDKVGYIIERVEV